MRQLARSARLLLGRYSELPAWVLLSQLFLGTGWLRAATAHGLSDEWWSGAEVLTFLAEEEDRTVGLYVPFVELAVQPAAAFVAAVVFALQVVVGVSLVANVRPIVGLVIGMGLNLHFILAGAVNPSIFYIVIALGILWWRMENTLTDIASRRLVRIGTAVAVVLAGLLIPSVHTMAPSGVIEDPALVLIFLALLTVVVLWVIEVGSSPSPAIKAQPRDRLSHSPIALKGDLVPSKARRNGAKANGNRVPDPPSVRRRRSDAVATTLLRLDQDPDAALDNGSRSTHESASTDSSGDDDSEPRPQYTSAEIVVEVERLTGFKFNARNHAQVARRLGVRPLVGQQERTMDAEFAVYVDHIDRYLYTEDWLEMLNFGLRTEEGFRELTGMEPTRHERSVMLALPTRP